MIQERDDMTDALIYSNVTVIKLLHSSKQYIGYHNNNPYQVFCLSKHPAYFTLQTIGGIDGEPIEYGDFVRIQAFNGTMYKRSDNSISLSSSVASRDYWKLLSNNIPLKYVRDGNSVFICNHEDNLYINPDKEGYWIQCGEKDSCWSIVIEDKSNIVCHVKL